MKKVAFNVTGLDCPEEIALLRKALQGRKGVSDLTFDLLQSKMSMTLDFEETTLKEVVGWVKEVGLKATLWEGAQRDTTASFWSARGRLVMTSLSGIFLIAGVGFHLFEPILTRGLYLGAIVFGAYFVAPKAFFALRRLHLDMHVLMVVAMVGAVAIGQHFEGAMVAFLFSVALLLENWSMARARRAVGALMEVSPTQAYVLPGGPCHVDQVAMGARILVRPGEKVPLDAIVEKGETTINQAPITGESVPVVKKKGDTVYAGTMNEDGAIECYVTKTADTTALARIIHLVQEAQSRRAHSEQWVEKFARIYTPVMIGIALLVALVPPLFGGGVWAEWLYRGLVILVIACPCALVISTPVSIIAGLTAAAHHGVLIKGGVFLEIAGTLRALGLDKTGTLTYGRPRVERIWPLHRHTEDEVLEKAAALEALSEHPLARAILREARARQLSIKPATSFRITKGKGAEGVIGNERYWIGSHRFMHEMNQETDEIHRKIVELEDAGHSTIAVGNDRHVCGLISLADQPRKGMNGIVQEMKRAGIERVVMLTGDNAAAAAAIAKVTQVDAFKAELLPEDKVKEVEELKKEWQDVAMIGDGVNDAPAMATASLGIAMGAIGTDVAIETADIALMSDDLSKVPWLLRHSRQTVRAIRQNIAVSVGVKALFLCLAALGLASLWMAIIADAGTSLLVVFNGLRLLKGSN